MAEEKLPVTPADIDNMSDEQVAELKKELTSAEPEALEKNPQETEQEAAPAEKKKGKVKEPKESVAFDEFHHVNKRRQDAEDRAEQAQRTAALATQRLQELLEASRPQPEPQYDDDPIPPEGDLVARLDWVARDALRRREREEEQARLYQEQTQQAQVYQNALGQVEQRFLVKRDEDPELQPAYETLINSFRGELQAFGWTGPALEQEMQKLELQHIRFVHDNNIPVEEYIKHLAQARAGWKPGQVNGSDDGQGQPHREQIRDPKTGQFKAVEQIEKREEARKKSLSLGGSGSPVEMGEMTPQMVVDMSDEQFAEFKKKYGENAMRKAFGA